MRLAATLQRGEESPCDHKRRNPHLGPSTSYEIRGGPNRISGPSPHPPSFDAESPETIVDYEVATLRLGLGGRRGTSFVAWALWWYPRVR